MTASFHMLPVPWCQHCRYNERRVINPHKEECDGGDDDVLFEDFATFVSSLSDFTAWFRGHTLVQTNVQHDQYRLRCARYGARSVAIVVRKIVSSMNSLQRKTIKKPAFYHFDFAKDSWFDLSTICMRKSLSFFLYSHLSHCFLGVKLMERRTWWPRFHAALPRLMSVTRIIQRGQLWRQKIWPMAIEITARSSFAD